MKLLLVYINPEKKFLGENEVLIKIQIDNSLDLGWKKEDIILITNFPFEYNGVKSTVVSGESFHAPHVQATKFTTIVSLFKKDFFQNELYWAPDLESYQNEPISEEELGLNNFELGLTTYGWNWYWCLGSFFFKKGAKEFFLQDKEAMDKYQIDDEKASRIVTRENKNNINSKIKTLNITYNFGMRHIDINWKNADKPIKVVHFHPFRRGRINTLDIFMYGKNEIGIPLMSERLIKIFESHGVK